MKIKIALPFLLLGITIFFLRDQLMETGPQTKPNIKGVSENIDFTGGFSESIPTIDFPLLGEARPTDLIDMALSFPESIKQLDGRRVSLVGFMAPFDNLDDMSRCMIVPSYVGCTFCSPPNKRQVVFIPSSKNLPMLLVSFGYHYPIEIMKERPRVLFTRLRTPKLGSIRAR
jgi:hypothetical protein